MSDPRPPAAGDDGGAGLASIVGSPAVVRRVRSIVANPVRAAWDGTPGVVPPAGVLFYGPPGERLAALREALAAELGVGVLTVDVRVDDPPVDQQVVLALTGIDELCRDLPDPAAALDRLFERLARLPGSRRPLPVATSAAPWHLDRSLIAPGRFDRLVFVPPPDWAARSALLELAAAEGALDVAARVPLLAAATVGWCGADLDDLLDQLALRPGGTIASEVARSSMLLDVVASIVPRTRSWIGRVRALADEQGADGMFDDLVTWLRRAE